MQDIICYPEQGLNPDTEVSFLRQTSVKETAPLHTHCFSEIFLVTHGKALHVANHCVQTIEAGDLVLIRPSDAHCYDFYQTYDFEFMNLGFPVKTFEAVCSFLDHVQAVESIKSTLLPPCFHLSPEETDRMSEAFLHIQDSIDHAPAEITRYEFRVFLSYMIVQYFMGYHDKKAEESRLPGWLKNVIEEMSKIDNTKLGFSRMLELASCSKEHLCREFKRYTGSTPTEFINRQRLHYSMYLLCHTELEIVEIADSCGFNNLSHFYHLFKKQFGIPPSSVRRSS